MYVFVLTLVHRGKNIQTVLIARFFAGAFGSTGSTMVGGTVADIFAPHEYVFCAALGDDVLTIRADVAVLWHRSPLLQSAQQASVR